MARRSTRTAVKKSAAAAAASADTGKDAASNDEAKIAATRTGADETKQASADKADATKDEAANADIGPAEAPEAAQDTATETEKTAKAAQHVSVTALQPIRHDGRRYATGDTFDVPAATRDDLMAVGAVE